MLSERWGFKNTAEVFENVWDRAVSRFKGVVPRGYLEAIFGLVRSSKSLDPSFMPMDYFPRGPHFYPTQAFAVVYAHEGVEGILRVIVSLLEMCQIFCRPELMSTLYFVSFLRDLNRPDRQDEIIPSAVNARHDYMSVLDLPVP